MTDEEKYRVFIVDDSPQEIMILVEQLKDKYLVTAATSADDALQMLGDCDTPDLMLLDVNMPGTNGYEACKMIREAKELIDMDVIFISGNDATDEIIKGLDAGAVDYVIKPYDADVLLLKLDRAFAARENRKQLTLAAKEANHVALNAMSNAGDYGVILQFLRDSLHQDDATNFLKSMLQVFAEFDLSASLCCKLADYENVLCDSGNCNELETQILLRMMEADEAIVEQEKYVFISRGCFSVLIRNMPDDENKSGRLKDSVMVLLETSTPKMEHLVDLLKGSVVTSEGIENVVELNRKRMEEMKALFADHSQASVNIMDEMMRDVEELFVSHVFTDEQENALHKVLGAALNRALDHFDGAESIHSKADEIITSISTLTKSP